MLEVESIL